MERVLRFLSLITLFFLSVKSLGGISSGAAASETEWQNHQDILQTRLIVGSIGMQKDGKVMFGWEAKLAPGWKTYWRSPGEAGLPVRVFVGSVEQEALYPFPERFELFGLETYGYSKYVMLPFFAKIPNTEGRLAVDADFMVCKEICIPFRTTYHLDAEHLKSDVSIHDSGLQIWLDKTPAQTGGDGAGLDILSAKVVGRVGHQKIIVDAKANEGLSKSDMLAEVNDMFHFGKPQIRLLADGKTARFVLPAMTGKDPEDLRGLNARLTFTNGRGASIERFFTLGVPKP